VIRKFRVEPRLAFPNVIFGDPRQRRTEQVWLGRLAELGGDRTAVLLDCSVEHVIAVVGKRGSGKSFTLGVLIEGLAAQHPESVNGKLIPSHAVLLLDSLNIYWPTGQPVPEDPPSTAPSLVEQQKLLRQWRLKATAIRVSLWAPAGFAPTFLSGETEEFRFSVNEFTSQDWGDLLELDLIRDPMGRALEESWRKAVTDGWEQSDGTHVPSPHQPSLQTVVRCIEEDRELDRHFSPETLRGLQQRFRALGAHDLFGTKGTSLTTLLKAGQVSVLLLAEVPDDIRRVFVSVLGRRLLQERAAASAEAKKRALLGERTGISDGVPPTWFVIDEAQNLLPAGASTAATQALVRFVREGRNHGLSFVVTTQQPTAVDARIMAQVDTLLAHQLVTAKDVQVVLDNLKSPLPRSIKHGPRLLRLGEALPLLGVGQAVVSSPELARAIFLAVRPRVSMHGGFEA
jgi:DNA helicase HerA-like ATPase